MYSRYMIVGLYLKPLYQSELFFIKSMSSLFLLRQTTVLCLHRIWISKDLRHISPRRIYYVQHISFCLD